MPAHVLAVEFVGPVATRYSGDGGRVPSFTPSEWMASTDGRERLRAFADAGWSILLHTVLVNPDVADLPKQVHELQEYMTHHAFPWDAVHTEVGKPVADLYVNTLDELLRCSP